MATAIKRKASQDLEPVNAIPKRLKTPEGFEQLLDPLQKIVFAYLGIDRAVLGIPLACLQNVDLKTRYLSQLLWRPRTFETIWNKAFACLNIVRARPFDGLFFFNTCEHNFFESIFYLADTKKLHKLPLPENSETVGLKMENDHLSFSSKASFMSLPFPIAFPEGNLQSPQTVFNVLKERNSPQMIPSPWDPSQVKGICFEQAAILIEKNSIYLFDSVLKKCLKISSKRLHSSQYRADQFQIKGDLLWFKNGICNYFIDLGTGTDIDFSFKTKIAKKTHLLANGYVMQSSPFCLELAHPKRQTTKHLRHDRFPLLPLGFHIHQEMCITLVVRETHQGSGPLSLIGYDLSNNTQLQKIVAEHINEGKSSLLAANASLVAIAFSTCERNEQGFSGFLNVKFYSIDDLQLFHEWKMPSNGPLTNLQFEDDHLLIKTCDLIRVFVPEILSENIQLPQDFSLLSKA